MTQVRRRYVPDSDYDDRLPFGGKVVLAKKKKPQSWIYTILEFAALSSIVALLYYSYFHFDHLHFHVTHMYAQMGHAHAQHAMGHKYLNGAGVKRNHTAAFQWFRKAADQGHPHSAYNLAVGHMQGYDTDVKKGEAHDLIKYAVDQGVEEAHDVYHRVCTKGHCKH
ncbi:uncharacterized protein TNIN_480881 [Trichonephila inaurata madagascariensis]|uniref:HCP-like protein n=1 Tax=Trichonephila inaurata madagascariensis TaxID=2747483 RepID=A0A8X6WZN6_9ARAC|nr:uncharacterized protein TNIN_480881 [Trichonephila inaurata madagascariensis]